MNLLSISLSILHIIPNVEQFLFVSCKISIPNNNNKKNGEKDEMKASKTETRFACHISRLYVHKVFPFYSS